MFSEKFIAYATKHSYGSEQPVLSWSAAQKFEILKPTNQLDYKFSTVVDNIIETVLNNHKEIGQLNKLRDELLPLLMNGQLTIA